MFCSACGANIFDDSAFCPVCGAATGGAPARLTAGVHSAVQMPPAMPAYTAQPQAAVGYVANSVAAPKKKCGKKPLVIGVAVTIAVIAVALGIGLLTQNRNENSAVVSSDAGINSDSTASANADADIVKLQSVGWYTDESGQISDSATLESGLEYFYEKTGVRAYLYILSDDLVRSGLADGNKAMELYMQIFGELGGKFPVFMVVFRKGDGEYSLGGSASEKAQTIMGKGYFNSFGETLHEAFSSTETDEEAFSEGFRAFADEVAGGGSE